jgi:glutamyl-Q tRNA(Asp) synthetase
MWPGRGHVGTAGEIAGSLSRMSQTAVFRFAPSPNGELHLGHALSAITGFEMARRSGGRFLLRIEDIDIGRTREDFVQGILEDLAWLGLTWEEPVLRQSKHFPVYIAAAARLEAMGLLYPCFATRGEIAAAAVPGLVDPDGAPLYPGLHRQLSPEALARRKARAEPFAMRLDMERARILAKDRLAAASLTFTEFDAFGRSGTVEARPERWGDAVIVRKDVAASYHLAVVVDDARQGVTNVTRGMDLYAATDLHRLLQVLLDLAEPAYHHHRLVEDEGGRKLSKSAGDTSLRSLRRDGVTPAGIRRLIGL